MLCRCRSETPNIDRALENGIKFTDGYSTSAVCTPARYSVLTGEYPLEILGHISYLEMLLV